MPARRTGSQEGKGSQIMHKTSLVLLGATAGAAMTLFAIDPLMIFATTSADAAVEDTYRQLNLFGDIFERVRADYVEQPDDTKLIESAIAGMLAGLDPHSSYMDPKSLKDLREETSGEFGGLGIEITMEDGLIKVVAPIDETPAVKAGILANDLIVKVYDQQVQFDRCVIAVVVLAGHQSLEGVQGGRIVPVVADAHVYFFRDAGGT